MAWEGQRAPPDPWVDIGLRYVKTTRTTGGALPRIRSNSRTLEGTALKIKSQQDFWSGLMFITAGIGFAIGATNYSMGSSARPGPGYFPLILSVIMALLGCVVLFKSLTIETEDGQPVGHIAWRPLLVVTTSIVVFGLALPRLGMFVTVPLLILMVSFAGDGFKWKDWVGTSIVLTAGSWLVFIYGLNLTIPLKPAFMG